MLIISDSNRECKQNVKSNGVYYLNYVFPLLHCLHDWGQVYSSSDPQVHDYLGIEKAFDPYS